MDPATRRFLLTCALLPSVTAAAAECLTGEARAGAILERLARHHYFTQKRVLEEPTYQFHGLFRRFLLARGAAEFAGGERRVFEPCRRTVAPPGAERGSGAPAGGGRSLGRVAPPDPPGRTAARRAGPRPHTGALDYGAAVRSARRRSLAVLLAGRLPHGFRARRRASVALLAWAEVVDSFLMGWGDLAPLDGWIDWLAAHPGPFPGPDIEARCASSMIGAMVWRQPDRSDMDAWAARTLVAVRQVADPDLRLRASINLMQYYLLTCDRRNIFALREEMRPGVRAGHVTPLSAITGRWIDAMAAFWSGDVDAAVQALVEALQWGESHGVHLWDHMIHALGVYGAILKDDEAAAEESLRCMAATLHPERKLGLGHYQCMASARHFAFGNHAQAAVHGELAVRMAREIGGDRLYFPD
jgi:hypothetical protein